MALRALGKKNTKNQAELRRLEIPQKTVTEVTERTLQKGGDTLT